MDAVESLVARLGLDYSDFKEGMVKSGEAVKGLNENIEMMKQGLAAGAIGEFIKGQLEGAAATVHFAQNVGISTDTLQAFTYAGHEHSVAQQEVERIWTTSKLKLDQLRAGLPQAVEDFEKLGLTVNDFKGLALDEALERITKAYIENEDHAGAFAALQEIVGTKSRHSTELLKELGEEGFGALIKAAKEHHAVIDGQTLGDLERVNKEWESMFNTVKVGGAEIVGYISKFVSSIAALASGMELLTEASLKGGIFTASGRAQMKADLQATGEELLKIWHAQAGAADASAKHAASTKETLPPLRETKELTEARAKLDDVLAKNAREGASVADQIRGLEQQITEHKQKAAAAVANELVYAKELTKIAELEGDMRKLKLKQLDDGVALFAKEMDIAVRKAPLQERDVLLQAKVSAIEGAIAESKAKGYDTAKLEGQLAEARLGVYENQKKVAEDLLRTVGDLVTGNKQEVETAKVHLQILSGQLSSTEALWQVQALLAKGVANLTDDEKLRLNALVSQLTIEQKQAEVHEILAKGVENLTEEDRVRLAVLNGQLDALNQQHKTMLAIVSLGAAKAVGGIRTYNDPIEQANYEKQLLDSAAQQVAQDIDAITKQIAAYRTSQSSFGQYEIGALQAQLAALNQRRQNLRDYVFNPNYSDARGLGLFAEQVNSIGDPLGVQKKNTDTLTQVATGVNQLNQRLATAGFETI